MPKRRASTSGVGEFDKATGASMLGGRNDRPRRGSDGPSAVLEEHFTTAAEKLTALVVRTRRNTVHDLPMPERVATPFVGQSRDRVWGAAKKPSVRRTARRSLTTTSPKEQGALDTTEDATVMQSFTVRWPARCSGQVSALSQRVLSSLTSGTLL